MRTIKGVSILLNWIRTFFRIIGLNPRRLLYAIKGVPYYYTDLFKYLRASPGSNAFRISFSDAYPVYGDRFDSAGVAKGHYFHQDIWAAKKIFLEKPEFHVDIGSRIDGFISHLLVFMNVTVVDIRPLKSNLPELIFVKGDIKKLDFDDGSISSISCLHAIEHVGLGRYGDNIDYLGWLKGLKELERVIKIGGVLYLGVPVGRERVCFNAHRVFNPSTIVDALPGLQLTSFSYVDDNGDCYQGALDFEDFPSLEYGCGLFEFRKYVE